MRRAIVSTPPSARPPTRSSRECHCRPAARRQPAGRARASCRRPACRRTPRRAALFHVRNDHANVQVRINGVMMPDGVTGFGSFLDTDLIGSISLDHRRTAGGVRAAYHRPARHHDTERHFQQFRQHRLLRRQSRHHPAELRLRRHYCPPSPHPTERKPAPGAACIGGLQYFVTGHYLQTTEGIENPLPTLNAIHDFSQQEKGFAYASDLPRPLYALKPDCGDVDSELPDSERSRCTGAAPAHCAPRIGVTGFNSSKLNENQDEDTQFGVLALQRSVNGFDGQIVLLHPLRQSAFHPGSDRRPVFSTAPLRTSAGKCSRTAFRATARM